MTYNFFALLSRMKYIERWALMRNSRAENLSEHAMEVAMIAHALCVIANKIYNRGLNPDRAAVIGIYHDASEIITGDMPTPVKYCSLGLKEAYKEVENNAKVRLLDKLPIELRSEYEKIFMEKNDDEKEIYIRKLVHAADKLSALIKCIEEERSGNREFEKAKESMDRILDKYSGELPEVEFFMKKFLPPYGSTLDELQN